MHKSDLALLRPAIELALGVARSGEADDPPQPAPAALRPFLSFSRLPSAALEATRRAVDRDEAFRARVLAAAADTDLGDAGRLWLERPDGWQETLAGLTEQASSWAGSDERLVREEKRQARRQGLADEAAVRHEHRARRAEAELEQTRREAAELRRSNRALSGELERTEAHVVSLTEERQAAVRQLKATEATLVERAQETKRARDEAERLRRDLAAAQQRAAVAEARAAGLPPPPEVVDARKGGALDADRQPPIDLARASSTVGDASVAAERLAAALGELASLLAPVVPASKTGGPRPRSSTRGRGGASTPPTSRRRPERLPRGWVDDTPQAALHLARLPGSLFLVDGYNVSKTAWPELELNAQRLRLVNAVAELRMRLGTHVEVVFDGADEGRLATRALPESVRVTFTPFGIEADDVVLERIDEQPPERSVVVVSSDRRVKDGARERGASVLSSATFLSLLR